jgi:hypothetical protein
MLRLKKAPLFLICGSTLSLAAIVVATTLVVKPAAHPPSLLTLPPAVSKQTTTSPQAANPKPASSNSALAGHRSAPRAGMELTQSSGGCTFVSNNGRFVVFDALQHIGGKAIDEVLIKDRLTAAITRVSRSTKGAAANGGSGASFSMSSDNRRVIFSSDATNLAPGTNKVAGGIYMRDLTTHTTTLVSVSTTGQPANDISYDAHISGDGRYVVFTSRATNLAIGDRGLPDDVYVRDLLMGTTTLVSATPEGKPVGGRAMDISADGTLILFTSVSSEIVPNDTNNGDDLFLRNVRTQQTRLVGVDPSGKQVGDRGLGASGVFTADESEIDIDGAYLQRVDNGSERPSSACPGECLVVAASTGGSTVVGEDGPLGDGSFIFHDGSQIDISRYFIDTPCSVTDDGRYVGLIFDPAEKAGAFVFDVLRKKLTPASKW